MTADLQLRRSDTDASAPATDAEPGSPSLVFELADGTRLPEIIGPWRDLFHLTLRPNPFFGPDFLLPLLGHLVRPGSVRAALVWRTAPSGERRLAALLPLRRPRPLLDPVVAGLTHPLIADATPLLCSDHPDAAARALLAGLSAAYPGRILCLDLLGLDDGPADALRAAATAGALPSFLEHAWRRAAIRADLDSETYLKERVSPKRLRELRRLERRLGDDGTVALDTLADREDVRRGVADFLRIEASGWKGRQGTALASRPDTRAFAEAALAGGGDAPAVLVDTLALDGRPVAAAVHLVAGTHAVAFKCAYDESLGRASPGVVLDAHTLRQTLDGGRLRLMDSGALPGHPVEALWRETIGFGTLLIGLGTGMPVSRLEAQAARSERFKALERRLKSTIKGWLGRKETALKSAE